ncbi:MAG: hypothetical protein ACRELB_27220 [Polyangiaceae bacterium]
MRIRSLDAAPSASVPSLLSHASHAAWIGALVAACSGGGGNVGGPGPVGSSCSQPAQCYVGLDAGALQGQVTCLGQVQGGYCTHTCQADSDCCALPGECTPGYAQVCASFESSGQTYCFWRCDAAAIAAAPAGTTDPTAYCQRWDAAFTCRSTGGGANNAKFCGP